MPSKGRVLLTIFFVAAMILSVAPIAFVSALPVMEIPPNLKRIELALSINGEMWASQVLASSLDPADDDHYELITINGYNLKWDVPTGGVLYVINPSNAPVGSSVEVEAAFEAWDNEVSIELYADPTTDDGARPSTRRPDYENVVSWGRIRQGGVVAMASIWYDSSTVIDGSYLIVDADIIFNTLQPWGIDPDGEGSQFTLLNAFDVRNVGTHEVGHLCGLGDIYDSSHSELTMYGYTDYGEVKRISLGLGDSLGVQEMYGSGDPGDTIPPAQVTGLTVTTVSSSRLDLSWDDNEESDLDHYNVYRSTTSGGSYDLVASPITNGYSDTGLTASTTYYYTIRAVDTSGNEGEASLEASGMTSEGPALPTMHVANIEMDKGSRAAGRNTFVWAIATVTIVDADGALEGATVYGHWDVATTNSDSGTTDANGEVSLQSDSVKNPTSGTTFTFVVDNVVLSGWDYDSSANVETSDSTEV